MLLWIDLLFLFFLLIRLTSVEVIDATKKGEALCPYCGDTLPTVMSARLRSSLAKILTRQEERLQARQDLLRRERTQDEHLESSFEPSIAVPRAPSTTAAGVTTPKKPWVPRPRKLERLRTISTLIDPTTDALGNDDDVASGSGFFAEKEDDLQQRLFGKISAVEKFEFCRIHLAEDKIIPAGLERNYPLFILFDELPDRIRKMEPELLGIIRGTVASPYLDRALANYRKLGHGARNPQAVLAGVQLTLVIVNWFFSNLFGYTARHDFLMSLSNHFILLRSFSASIGWMK